MSIWRYIEKVQFLKSNEISRSGQTFSSEVSPVVCYVNRTAKTTPYILSYWSKLYLKIHGVMAISKFGLFFNLVT